MSYIKKKSFMAGLMFAALSFAPAVGSTFNATEDAMTKSSNPNTNYGKDKTLAVDGSGSTNTVQSYIKFNVTNVSGTITSAIMRVYVTDASVDGPGLYATGTNWSESKINWKNRPAMTGNKLVAKGAVALGWLDYDVLAKVTGNGTYSFVLYGDSADETILSSREGSYPPQLIITTGATASPTPTATPASSVSPTPTPQDTSMTFTPIYDSPQVINGETFNVSGATTDHSIGKSPNGKIYRFEVRYGEARVGQDPSADRAELSHQVDFAVGKTMWVSYSYLYEVGAPVVAGENWNVMGQWHAGIGSPPLAMILPYDNQYKADIRAGSSTNYTKYRPILEDAFVRGRWYNIVMRVRFSPVAGQAICQIWINGKQVFNDTQSPMGYTDSTRNYWKFGIYRARAVDPQAAQFANMEVKEETSTQNLSSRITNPLPIIGK